MSYNLKQFSCSQIINSKKSTRKTKLFNRSQVREKDFSQPITSTATLRDKSQYGFRKFSSQPVNPTIKKNVLKKIVTSSARDEASSSQINVSESEKILVVFLPFIMSDSLKRIKQPLLFKVDGEKFKKFPSNTSKSLYKLKIGGDIVEGKVFVTGDDYSQVKINLRKAIETDQGLKDCLSIIGNLSQTRSLEYVEIERSPNYLILNMQAFENFLANFKSREEINHFKRVDQARSKENQLQVQAKHSKSNSKLRVDPSEDPTGSSSEGKRKETCSCCNVNDKATEEDSLKQLEKIRDRLLERKQVLSQLDLPSLIMADLIDCIDAICAVLIHNVKNAEKKVEKIPHDDKTFKDKKNGLIFVEGILPFSYDSYKNALLAGKSNPLTLAYQLVKSCFPESYYLNVTLGKRFYRADEMKHFLDSKRINEGKLPLPYVWGFKNPMDEPFEGDFDLKLGLERVQALIVHILRKCDIFELDENLIKNIRGRLVRELNARNAAHRTRQNTTEENSIEKDQSIYSASVGISDLEISQESDFEPEEEYPFSHFQDSDIIQSD